MSFKALLAAVVALFIVCPLNAMSMETSAKQAIVIDDNTNTVLFEKNADEKMHPSSMTKLMTVYIVFTRLKEGSLKMTDELPVSEKAWRTQGSKTFVDIGGKVSVEDLLQGIIVQSGNDACIVVAEGLAGSEEGFAQQMNEMAKKLGMTNTHYVNADGMPDDAHLMSARDLAIISQHIIHDFPEYYHYFSQKEFVHHGIKQGNRNLLLYKNSMVDGLKTGHTDAGGFGIVVSGKDASGRRIILVINGLKDEKERAEAAERLFAFALRDFEERTLVHKGDVVEEGKVWFGETPTVPFTVDKDVRITLPKANKGQLKFILSYKSPIVAPIKAGVHIADLKIESASAPTITVPLVAAKNVNKLSGFSRVMATLRYIFSKS
jgi:D-alanyl-D-alanine carboxypeptidase (penicillin-binding protein 5/6)